MRVSFRVIAGGDRGQSREAGPGWQRLEWARRCHHHPATPPEVRNPVTQALDGIRILDLSWGIAGPLGVLLLAEHGADVIKVEPPGGDPFRDYAGYRCWNRSRRSVAVDLQAPTGLRDFTQLAATADVVVETFRPGVLDRLGAGYAELSAANPRLILVSCPPYPDGHRRAGRPGYDALVQASSGMMTDQPGWRMGPTFL